MKKNLQLLLMIIAMMAMTTACKGTKKMAYTPAGTWDYKVANTPQGDVTGKLIITKDGDSYKATLEGSVGTIELDDVEIMDNKLTAKMDYQGYTLDVTGTFEGETYKGEVGLDYNTFPMTATRVGK